MKNIVFVLLFSLFTVHSFAQKKDKIKGSKIVTIETKEVENFEAIEVGDNLEINLVKAEKNSIEIEADDNLHDVIKYEFIGTTLKLYTLMEISSSKKCSIKVNYTNTLQSITAKEKSTINALSNLELNNIKINAIDNSKLFLNVKCNNLNLSMNDKSQGELNIKTDKSSLEISKNATLKALLNSSESKIDLYQKANATIEGDISNAKIRLDNNGNLTAKKLTIKHLDLTMEAYSNALINVTDKLTLTAAGKSEVKLLGEPKIEIIQFKNNTTLSKIEK